MNIDFDDPQLKELQELFNTINSEDSIFMSHYELSQTTGRPADQWKKFLTHPAVSIWMTQELQLFKEYQLKQMIRNATDNNKSVGAAQMINSLTKTLQDGHVKTGPHIIYTYVPMTEDQEQGTTVETMTLTEDVLALIPDDWRDQFGNS